MYICMCNPFTDKDVSNHLNMCGKTRVKDVYTACTQGEEMNCGSCACELKSIVDAHNNAITINELNTQMLSVSEKETETA